MLKRFIQYYKPHKAALALDMTASLFISLIAMVYPIITNKVLKDYFPDKNIKAIIIAGCVVLLLYVIRLFLRWFVTYYGHLIGVRMQAQMRRDLFAHLQKLPYSYYDDNETGKIMTRITSDLFDVSELAHHGPETLLISSVMIIGSFIYLCTLNVWLTLIIFTCIPFLVAISLVYQKRMGAAFKTRRAENAVINASIESSISGIRVTKAYTNAKKEAEKFEVGNKAYVKSCKKAYNAMAQFHSGTTFITDIFNVIILFAGGIFLVLDKIDPAIYATFIVSVNLFITPLLTLFDFTEVYQEGFSGFSRFVEIMDTAEEIEKENAVDIGRVSGEIELRNVEFAYENSEDVLHHINLIVKKGETLALVGPSGGGKTTICHLIPNFYRTTGGEILIDGKNITDVTLDSLRRNIGIVQQDVFLFGGSIRENILYGKLDATDDEIKSAAVHAGIHDWIMSLEHGYDTEIGERGVKLSGGQKQRISIARVFLKDPAILILDEATSALDNTTEILIQKSLEELCRGRTTIVVAHRLSTIRRADEIAVIAGGVVTERGTHTELMKKDGGIYKELYELQFRAVE